MQLPQYTGLINNLNFGVCWVWLIKHASISHDGVELVRGFGNLQAGWALPNASEKSYACAKWPNGLPPDGKAVRPTDTPKKQNSTPFGTRFLACGFVSQRLTHQGRRSVCPKAGCIPPPKYSRTPII